MLTEFIEGPWADPLTDDATVSETYAVKCPDCDATHNLEITASHSGREARLLGHPEVSVSFMATDFDSLAERWEIPAPDPHVVFDHSFRDVQFMLREMHLPEAQRPILYRMLFVHLFSMTEAYLADTIIRLCERDDTIRRRLLEKLDGLRDAKVGLIEAELGPEMVKGRVRDYLQRQQFHRFSFVDKLFQIAINVRVLPDDPEARRALFSALAKRHDCVHRGGRDRDGNFHEITVGEVYRLGDLFWSMVQKLDNRVEEMDRARNEADIPPFDDSDVPF